MVVTKWLLSPRMVELIWALCGRLHINIFAMKDNSRLQTFMSPFLDEMAWAMDAMSISWKGMWVYAFPPFPLVPKVFGGRSERKW